MFASREILLCLVVRSADTIVLCGGRNIEAATNPEIMRWIRHQARDGPRIVGPYSAAYTMAVSGLFSDRRAMYCDLRSIILEQFPSIKLKGWICVMDGKPIASIGGLNSIDMMLDLVLMFVGPETSIQVVRKANYSCINSNNQASKVSISDVDRVIHSKVKTAVRLIEQHLEDHSGPFRAQPSLS
jgi:transcriptional regulator GlxA family with amidase domain